MALVGPQEPLDRADTEVTISCDHKTLHPPKLHRPTAVGMTKAGSTPFVMSQECGAILLGHLFPVFLPWRLQVGSKCTRQVAIWGWQDLGILASKTG